MHLNPCNPANLIKTVSICTLSTLLLFCGFYSNFWHVAPQGKFVRYLRDTESHIVGRIVKSRQDGFFSAGGLTGVVWLCNGDRPDSPFPIHVRKDQHDWICDDFDQPESLSPIHVRQSGRGWPTKIQAQYQYLAYKKGLPFDVYSPYMSQIGGQGMLFSLLDRILPISPYVKLTFFYAFTCILSAVALTIVILWFYWEFGLCVALCVLSSAVFSQWLVVFGRNLWWSIWAFYLPMIIIMYFFKYERIPANHHYVRLGVLVFMSVLVKCLVNGYEYITTTLIMMMVPYVYYTLLNRLSARQFLMGSFVAILGSFLAIVLSFTILCYQIASVKGSMVAGVEHIVFSFRSRAHGNINEFPASYAASLDASTTDVVITYLKGTFFDLNRYNRYLSKHISFVPHFGFKMRYIHLIFLFLSMSFLVFFAKNERFSEKQRQRHIALLFAMWFSILAPLSWLIVFKAHSHEHTHMNYIVWQMPFTLFGFALCGLGIKSLPLYLVRLPWRST